MMRWLFWLLLTAYALFFAFMQWGEVLLGNAGYAQPRQQFNEEKIKLLKTPPMQPVPQPASSSPAVASPPTQSKCIEWGEFSGDDLARAASALDALRMGDKVAQRHVEYTSGYWVYIPPRTNRAEVDKKISQLKSLGVEDYFVVQDPGKWHNAISLGVFRTGGAAQNFLGRIRDKGVKSAMAGERAGKLLLTVFVLKNPEAETAAKVAELQNGFPGSSLKEAVCD